MSSALINPIGFRRSQHWKLEPDLKDRYEAGTNVWIPCSKQVWQLAEVVERYDGHEIKLKRADGNLVKMKIVSDQQLPPLQNPDISFCGSDLTSLSYIHEPAVLEFLHRRFVLDCAIYTYCGIVLVAINPYQDMNVYGMDRVQAYRTGSLADSEPHVFAVAERAIGNLEKERRNQSVIVSGESGSGKTTSARYVMRYFAAAVSGSDTETPIERQVQMSSPILEAFGNAKTPRNANSSRFGKYTELFFDEKKRVTGAKIRTYLLEKSRVVGQAPEESNYHVFYRLCSARDRFPDLQLGESHEYVYLSYRPSDENDRQSFDETVTALDDIGLSRDDQHRIWKTLATILHMGNIKITHTNSENVDSCHYLSLDDFYLKQTARLLDIDDAELYKWLSYRKINSKTDTFEKPMVADEARRTRDALAKYMYESLFHWLVSMINKTMCESSSLTEKSVISVLDIYGFEVFKFNSFEQLCINYANEKLQQFFNFRMFKLEQNEYLAEGIQWDYIHFYDNQRCVDLIESKLGILDLLDEECRMPQGSDTSWVQKLHTTCTKWDRFEKPKFAENTFILKHFAGDVKYDAKDFLKKNSDRLIESQTNVLRYSPIVEPHSSCKQNKKTVGSKFKDSLSNLLKKLSNTTPNYIKCVKPNDNQRPFDVNAQRIVEQLRSFGLIEILRISAAGFPTKWAYVDFVERYRVLIDSKSVIGDDLKLTSQNIVEEHLEYESNYNLGYTKIFLRAGEIALLESKRKERLNIVSTLIQKTWRMFVCRKKHKKIQQSAVTIQRYVRGFIGRSLANRVRRTKAAIIVQKIVRGWLERKKYLRVQISVLVLQRYYREFVARKLIHEFRQNLAAVRIQSAVRMWLCRRKYQRDVVKIIRTQCCIRKWIAIRRLNAVKKEAKIVYLTNMNESLINKMASMQQEITNLKVIIDLERSRARDQNRKYERLLLEKRLVEEKLLAYESNTSNEASSMTERPTKRRRRRKLKFSPEQDFGDSSNHDTQTKPLCKCTEMKCWIRAIEKMSKAQDLTKEESSITKLLVSYENKSSIPLKQAKFRNFVKKGFREFAAINDGTLDRIYEKLAREVKLMNNHSMNSIARKPNVSNK